MEENYHLKKLSMILINHEVKVCVKCKSKAEAGPLLVLAVLTRLWLCCILYLGCISSQNLTPYLWIFEHPLILTTVNKFTSLQQYQ